MREIIDRIHFVENLVIVNSEGKEVFRMEDNGNAVIGRDLEPGEPGVSHVISSKKPD